eukprot:TRINITY_DN32957_c0_g1_i1.p1 TRINITY_DN32957_c0_g1~~TRINITY_DN32957_c0_g1_i1.p1  ORF type:complete len:397 (+),score=43.75 TRINITY_DN32957_c0_g1_i1:63-1193(+)
MAQSIVMRGPGSGSQCRPDSEDVPTSAGAPRQLALAERKLALLFYLRGGVSGLRVLSKYHASPAFAFKGLSHAVRGGPTPLVEQASVREWVALVAALDDTEWVRYVLMLWEDGKAASDRVLGFPTRLRDALREHGPRLLGDAMNPLWTDDYCAQGSAGPASTRDSFVPTGVQSSIESVKRHLYSYALATTKKSNAAPYICTNTALTHAPPPTTASIDVIKQLLGSSQVSRARVAPLPGHQHQNPCLSVPAGRRVSYTALSGRGQRFRDQGDAMRITAVRNKRRPASPTAQASPATPIQRAWLPEVRTTQQGARYLTSPVNARGPCRATTVATGGFARTRGHAQRPRPLLGEPAPAGSPTHYALGNVHTIDTGEPRE